MNISLPAFAPENLVSRDGFASSSCCCCCFLHINRSGLNHTVLYVVANPVVRGLLGRKRSEEHLPSSNESKIKTQTHRKRQRERNRNNKIRRPEKDRRWAFDRESLAYCQPRAIRYPPRLATMHPKTRSIYHIPYSKGFSFH